MRKRSALHSSHLADHGARPVWTLVIQLASPLVAAFAGGFLGCLVTLELTAIGVMSSLASASTTAVLCGIFLITRTARCVSGAFFPALYGGTFGGMTSVISLTNNTPGHSVTLTAGLFVALSIICGLAFLVATRVDARSVVPIASGYGGRLGMIAAIASFVFIDLAQRLLGFHSTVFPGIRTASIPEPNVLALKLGACMAGTFVTFFIFRLAGVAEAGNPERIYIASAVAVSGLALLSIFNSNSTGTSGDFYAGCFLGTSSSEPLTGWRQTAFGAVVLTATLPLVRAILPDVGGGLGLAAFFTVAFVSAVKRAIAMTWDFVHHGRRFVNTFRGHETPRMAWRDRR
jgi:hypothetical protein